LTELLIFGAGYTGIAIAAAARRLDLSVAVTSRGTPVLPEGAVRVPFHDAGAAIAAAACAISTAAPNAAGDPVLAVWGEAIRAARLQWLGYLSTTGVYGDHGGAWVDEDTPPAPGADRARRRMAAENAWIETAAGRPLDIIRLAGIYGPARSAFDDVRGGRARRVVKPGHAFGRIHRDDIAAGVLAAMARPPAGTRVLNFADDAPSESAAVLTEAARLLGVAPPLEVPFETAWASMSDMGRSFWAESRKVRAEKTKAALGIAWQFPSYREGLAQILAEEQRKEAGLF
jgi:nucleoside-diphosphate-sugar epimerase